MKEKEYIDNETLLGEQGNDLPAPSMARMLPGRRPLRLRLAFLVAIGWAACLAVPRLAERGRVNTYAKLLSAEEQMVQAYYDGIAGKGFGLFEEGCKDNSGKHPKHPHHRPWPHHPHKWIPPQKAEEIYLTVPTNDSCAAASKRYTAHAHPAGSGWDLVTAQMVKGDWERHLGLRASWYDEHVFEAGSHASQRSVRDSHLRARPYVWIDTYYPVMNTPVSSSVTLLSDPPVRAKLREAKLQGDPGSELADEVRVFHGLSVSGDVTAQYIYAGYGRKEDFDLLQDKGVDFTGKIALVKYGGNFRGLKVKAAQEAGAVGCIIFTDPGDDGDMTEANGHKQYPEGPARVVSGASTMPSSSG